MSRQHIPAHEAVGSPAAEVGMSTVSQLSFTRIGTQWSGPVGPEFGGSRPPRPTIQIRDFRNIESPCFDFCYQLLPFPSMAISAAAR